MELFLDSVNFDEIEEAFGWGILTGLTTTPTFMHRHGVKDVDGAIVRLSHLVPMLQVEALGDTVADIVGEAERLMKLPMNPDCEVVYKVPVSNIGVQAAKRLSKAGHRVNVHLIYTLSQAYLAMEAGATYICPLVGRLHDQGHDAMQLIEQAVGLTHTYRYPSKVMVSSVRHTEHVRQAMLLGAQACTVPWSVLKQLAGNALTDLGAAQFTEHTRLMTLRVADCMGTQNPVAPQSSTILDAMVVMTESGMGAVTVVDTKGEIVGVFTDGDMRRRLQEKGKAVLDMRLSDFEFNYPLTIEPEALLYDAVQLFRQHKVDNLIVQSRKKPVGMLDVQDLIQRGLIS